MANIIEVDYEAMPKQAMSMREHGKELNSEIVTAYQEIKNMHSSWYGQRYNSLVTSFNNIIPSINELLQLVVTDIPSTLETVANNYALADKGTRVTAVSTDGPQKIQEIPVINDVGMHFITSEVADVQSRVTDEFQKAVDDMDVIQSEYSRISWKSEAADAFQTRFTKLKSDITASFSNLNTQFTQLMNQTQEDIQTTENANTVK